MFSFDLIVVSLTMMFKTSKRRNLSIFVFFTEVYDQKFSYMLTSFSVFGFAKQLLKICDGGATLEKV